MFKHWLGIMGVVAVTGALLVGGVAVAQAAMNIGPWYHPTSMMGPRTTPRSYPMMGSNGGMMGNPNMMTGYNNTSATQSPASAAPVTGDRVTIQNFASYPANFQVKVGTTVTWTNQDTAPHTITFRDSSLTSSGLLQKGAVYRYTFTQAGTFTYYCQVHPTMTAQVVVTA
jgi:plastocyanin